MSNFHIYFTSVLCSIAVVDMRSDTVTKPTDEMRLAMFKAVVGDDVYCDDPTANKLESSAAKMLGKESSLIVPSGTMGNLLCLMVHCDGRGDEMLLGDDSHISIYEQGGSAYLGGVYSRLVKTLPNGQLDIDDIRSKIVTIDDVHFAKTKLICIENTHNRKGGRVLRPEYMQQVAELAKEKGLKVHLDGARLFNAATALNLPVSKLTECVDSVNVCLSKGLGAPIGSIIAGSKEFIAKTRRLRKALGGGMRQVGVIAAPGLIALEKGSKRLQEDHDNAQFLAQGLAKMSELGVRIDISTVETSIVVFSVVREDMTVAEFVAELEKLGVLMFVFGPTTVRCVLNCEVSRAGVQRALDTVQTILSGKYTQKND